MPHVVPRVFRSILLTYNHRGLALLSVLGVAVLMSLTVAGLIVLTSTHATTGRLTIERIRARYATDAGIAWAYAQILASPTFTTGAGIDLDLPGEPQRMQVDVNVAPIGASTSKQIDATVTYQVLR